MKQKASLLIIITALILSSCGDPLSYKNISLKADKQALSEEPIGSFSPGNCAYLFCSPENGKVIRYHNMKKTFIPASLTKLFSALFILKNTDNSHTFKTTLSYTGKITGGRLEGDIFLHGGGDPELSMRDLNGLVRELAEKGIQSVTGNFIYDDYEYAGRESLDKKMPDNAYYNPGLSPLSLAGNRLYATSSNGDLFLAPSLPFASISHYDGPPLDPPVQFVMKEKYETWLVPSEKFSLKRQPLPVKNPSLYTAWAFQNLCRISGITLPAPKRGHADRKSEFIAEHISRPVKDMVRTMLLSSSNLHAEMLTLAALKDKYGTTGHAQEHFMKFFTEKFSSVDWTGFRIENFSGLSSLNRVTPEQTSAVLMYLFRNGAGGEPVEKLLPMSGWDGTLQGRLNRPASAFRVYAKTGNIFYSSGLAGIMTGKEGKKYIFTVLISDIKKRRAYDSLRLKRKAERRSGASWSRSARKDIDHFIEDIIDTI